MTNYIVTLLYIWCKATNEVVQKVSLFPTPQLYKQGKQHIPLYCDVYIIE